MKIQAGKTSSNQGGKKEEPFHLNNQIISRISQDVQVNGFTWIKCHLHSMSREITWTKRWNGAYFAAMLLESVDVIELLSLEGKLNLLLF